jgi:glutamate racemase
MFDSGVGGLTVANAIHHLLPFEQLVYFGDTAHLPYGDKSSASIQYYSRKIADFLLEKGCKVVLVACNTASATAFAELQAHVGDRAIVLDVINPVIQQLAKQPDGKKVGVIGTKGTINSGAYERKIKEAAPGLEVVSKATPLLVPMIEEGFIYDDISNAIVRSYLSHESLRGISSLILGCTHYPIIKNQIRKFYEFQVEILDSALIVAKALKKILGQQDILNDVPPAGHQFYVSDYTDYFNKIARVFFEEEINLQQVDLWK